MNKKEALNFLKENCPFSEYDDDVSQEVIDKYDEIVKYVGESLDNDLILPLMLSFGPGGGYGIYQHVVFELFKFDKKDLLSPLIESLQHHSPDVRYWACQHAMDLSIPETAPYLRTQVEDENDDIAFFAATALVYVGNESDFDLIKNRSLKAEDEEGQEMFDEVLTDMRDKWGKV